MSYVTREGRAARQRAYWQRNKAKVRAAGMWSTAKRTGALAPWANRDAVEAVYAVAGAWCDAGVLADVDHIVPLKGETVRGLHCEQNLTVLPRRINRVKGNRVHHHGALSLPHSPQLTSIGK